MLFYTMLFLGRLVVRQAKFPVSLIRNHRFSVCNRNAKWTLLCSNSSRLKLVDNVKRLLRNGRVAAVSIHPSNGIPIGMALLGFKSKLLPIPAVDHSNDAIKSKVAIKSKKHNIVRRILRKIFSIIVFIVRGLQLWAMFTPIVIFYPLLFWNPTLKRIWWKYFIFMTNNAGPIFIKFAQWASTRRDLFSVEFCDQFVHLQRRTKPHSWKFTKVRLEQAFGRKWRDIFVRFDNDRQPVGSGCIAQVYKAYIKPQDIEDEDLLQEIIEDQNDDPSFNYFEGAEVIGFGHIFGTVDSELDEAETKRRQMRIEREIDRITTEHKHEQISNNISEQISNEELEAYSKSLLEEKLSNIDQDSDDLEGLIPIAIKVLHPNLQSQFERDLVIMKMWAWLIQFIMPNLRWLSLSECVDTFEKTMVGQLNLIQEAKHMDNFRAHFQDISNVRFASPVWPFVSRNVLVETFEDAEPLSTFLKESDEQSEFLTPELKSKIAEIGLNALLKMIFEDSLVHGDLHPGNISIQNFEPYVGSDSSSVDNLIMLDICDTLIVKPKTEKYQRLRVLILDCGITTSLTKEDIDKLLQLFSAVVRGKDKEVSDMFLKYSQHDTWDNLQMESFRKSMKKIIQKSQQAKLTLDTIDVGELLSDVFALLYKHKIKLEHNFVSIILAVLVIEGVGRSLDPNIDIIEMAKTYLL